jgi:hypothetical protein
MTEPNGYKHLEPRAGSRFKQLFLKGSKSTAEMIYSQTIGDEARNFEEIAEEYRNENDPKRDMQAKHITAAIDKLVRSGISVSNQLVVLNHWR